MKKTVLKTTALFALISIVCFACCTDRNIVEVDTDTEACKGRYRANIIGKWQLLQIIIVVHNDYDVNSRFSDTVDVSRQNVIYEFLANNQLIITGNIDDEFVAGKYTYRYAPRKDGILALPGPNFSINEIPEMYCPALCKNKQMYFIKRVYFNNRVIATIRQFLKLE